MGHVTILYKRGVLYRRFGSITQDFQVVRHCSREGIDAPGVSLPWEPTSFNCTSRIGLSYYSAHSSGMCINHLSETQECCLSPSKYCLHRTPVPFGWCPRALFRLESHESLRVTSVTRQRFSAHHMYITLGAPKLHVLLIDEKLPINYLEEDINPKQGATSNNWEHSCVFVGHSFGFLARFLER